MIQSGALKTNAATAKMDCGQHCDSDFTGILSNSKTAVNDRQRLLILVARTKSYCYLFAIVFSAAGILCPRAPLLFRSVKVDRENIARRQYRHFAHDSPDRTTVIAAVRGHMREHFFARHAALVAIGKGKFDLLVKPFRCPARNLIDVPAIGREDGFA